MFRKKSTGGLRGGEDSLWRGMEAFYSSLYFLYFLCNID
jgi:hypothetical protein